ncbi:MAG: [methyl-Co(III) methanol/glycine betaine-specific corrinoid protein]:coenzyme methyltransferase [Candidatus Methanomethylophilaceae archaeon]|nr:[methyl-Co(III) methanol/glycine betaine-specific corrinoid protein]:coenzyme methyltransferase [Candidatus Methanomethylophilaceae archaeon]
MDGRQRFLTALERDMPDRAPLFLRELTLPLDIMGYSTPEVCSGSYDSDKSARAVISFNKRMGQDAVVGCIHHLGMDVEPLGGEVMYPEYGIPSVVRHPFEDATKEMCLPDMSRWQYPAVIKSYRMVSELLPHVAIVCNIEGALTKAALLRGQELLIMDLLCEPDYIRSLSRFSTEMSLCFIEAVCESADPDCIFVAAATDNPDLLGLDPVMTFTLPELKTLRVCASRMGIPTVFHPHGDLGSVRNNEFLEGVISTGVAGIQFAEMNDVPALRSAVGERVSLLGGIDAFSTLLLGPKERIIVETDRFLRLFHPFRGYVFMCSCSLHRGIPLENVETVTETLRNFDVGNVIPQ